MMEQKAITVVEMRITCKNELWSKPGKIKGPVVCNKNSTCFETHEILVHLHSGQAPCLRRGEIRTRY